MNRSDVWGWVLVAIWTLNAVFAEVRVSLANRRAAEAEEVAAMVAAEAEEWIERVTKSPEGERE